MEMIPVQIFIPESMVPYLDDKREEYIFERNAMILYPFIYNMEISHGRAAEILGVHKSDLIDFYGSMGMPYLNQSWEDLIAEVEAYDKLKEDDNACCIRFNSSDIANENNAS